MIRLVLGVLGGVLLAYAIILPALYFSQRSLIFPAPASFPDLPQGYGAVRLRTSDGLELATAYRPAQLGKPVLVFFHGNGDNWTGGARALDALAKAGYGVLLPEYRGYGTNPGEPNEQGFYRDGRAALAWLAAHEIKPGRTVLIGNSIGSGVATQLASESSPAALVLISPFSSLPDVAAEKFRWLPVRWLVRDRFDNAAKLGTVKAPVLVLHGTADTMIPPEHAQRLAVANPRARLELLPGFDHDLAYAPAAQQASLQWLEAVLSHPAPDPGGHVGQPQVQPAEQQP